jgi:hypothetical protein
MVIRPHVLSKWKWLADYCPYDYCRTYSCVSRSCNLLLQVCVRLYLRRHGLFSGLVIRMPACHAEDVDHILSELHVPGQTYPAAGWLRISQ